MVVKGHLHDLSVVSSSRYHRIGEVIGFEGNLDILERENLAASKNRRRSRRSTSPYPALTFEILIVDGLIKIGKLRRSSPGYGMLCVCPATSTVLHPVILSCG